MALGPVDNPRALLREMYLRGPSSRSDLAKATGLTGAAVSRLTRTLMDEGLLVEGEKLEVSGKLGRKFVALNFSDKRYVVGIGIQAVAQWIHIADLQGRVLAQRSLALSNIDDAEGVLRRCAIELEEMFSSLSIHRANVLGLGMAIAGVIDSQAGTVVRAENLGWKNIRVVQLMSQWLGIPAYVESLLNSLALANNGFGLHDDTRNAVLVVASLGIGVSLVLNGKIVTGTGFAAGQIGHARVPGALLRCVCGRVGCLDTVASGRAILARFGLLATDAVIDTDNQKTVMELFQEFSSKAKGDPAIAEVLREAGRALGHILGVATSLLDPHSFVLTGMVSQDDFYMEGVRQSLDWYHQGSSRQVPELSRIDSTNSGAPVHLAFARFVLSKSPTGTQDDDE